MLRRAFLFGTLLASITVLTQTLHAQATPTYRANIPFDFTITNHSYPAGVYSIVRSSANVLIFRNAEGRSVAQALVNAGLDKSSVPTGQLRFLKQGHSYFLSELSYPDNAPGLHTKSRFMRTGSQSATEKEILTSRKLSPDRTPNPAMQEVALNLMH